MPSYLQTAVLLKRKNHDRFMASIEITAEIDGFSFKDTIQKLSGRIEDDPVVFDPHSKPMGPLWAATDMENLAQCDLQKLVEVRSTQFQPTAEDEQDLASVQAETYAAVETKISVRISAPLPPLTMSKTLSSLNCGTVFLV